MLPQNAAHFFRSIAKKYFTLIEIKAIQKSLSLLLA